MVEKLYVTYNQVHKLCQEAADRILNDFQPNLMIAIGGGGYVPARILRSFLKKPGKPNIPIQAIGLSLYEQLPTSIANGAPTPSASTTSPEPTHSTVASPDPDIEQPGTRVTRTQWLDLSSLEMKNLIGKSVLIVDEVDDTRTTLEYAVRELAKDVEAAREKHGIEGHTRFSVFVLHNKLKEKRGVLPKTMEEENGYLAARETGDVWICYPWEATNIEEHDRLAEAQAKGKA